MNYWTARRFKLKLKSCYTRITRNRLTATFFLFGFFHCWAQGIIQSLLYSIDAEYSTLLSKIEHAAHMDPHNHTWLEGTSEHYRLRMCNWIPHLDQNCSYVFQSDVDSGGPLTANDTLNRGELLRSQLSVPNPIFQNETQGNVTLSMQCTGILTFPAQESVVLLVSACTSSNPPNSLKNNAREDLAFVFLQFWLFILSVVAMVYDSVPHVAGVMARTLLTAWSAYAVWRTQSKKEIYQQLIANPGTPCSVDLFPIYFKVRLNYEIPDLVLNVTALYIAGHLSWTLFREYQARSFTTVGAPPKIVRMYRFYLAVQACLQLEVYALIAGMSLWIDQLLNTYIRVISEHTFWYVAVFVFFSALVLPWLILGWYSIRHEKKFLTAIFIFTAFVFFFTECIMFYSQVYRWTFVSWANLACFTVSSMLLIAASFILGIICMRNFGKGLAEYLHAESILESMDFSPEVFEHDVTRSHITLVETKPKRLLRKQSSASEYDAKSPYTFVMDDWIRQ
ncbi:hypothetical protein BDZ89DRAFT_1145505 [Hymenopellis radicata]|nr:hypothetical protein BDZ89DRAFT_1145505 [Hymenopellis radicata]